MTFELEITDPDGNQRQVTLGETTSIGRQPGNDLVFDDARVSRQHAVLECHDDLCWITDLGSSNGTAHGEERLPPNAPTPLVPGQEVRIGGWHLTLVASESLPLPTPPPVGEGVAADARQPDEEGISQQPASAPLPPSGEGASPEAAPVLPSPETGGIDPQTAPVSPPTPGEGAAGPPPPGPPAPGEGAPPASDGFLPPGLGYHSRSLLNYLPGIYHTEFMSRFLALFESILTPIEWNIDNFDLFLDPGSAPGDFLAWLAEWFDITFDPTWSDVQQRELLREAHRIYARRGTRWALSRVLEIYTGSSPTIIDADAALEPFTFRVILPVAAARLGREVIEHLIDAHKPTHTMYELEFG